MSVMERIFGSLGKNQTPPPPPAPATEPTPTNNLKTPPNKEPQSTEGTAPNGVVPPGATEGEPKSPVDKFGNLWEPAKPDESNPDSKSAAKPTTQQMMESAAKVDFTKVLDREVLQKIAAGGEEAVNAFAQALNKTAQTVLGQSTAVSQKLIEQAQEQTRQEILGNLPKMVRQQNLGESLLSQNPAFSHPGVRPVIDALQNQLSEKFPKASAAELNAMAKEYLTGMASIIAPPQQQSNQTPTTPVEEDWTKYFQS